MAENLIRYISHAKRINAALNRPMWLFKPETETVKGIVKKIYPEKGEMIFVSFRTFGGTETNVNGVLAIEDTVVIDTWYRPDITADCKLVDENGKEYEMLGTPEDMNSNHQYMRFKIRAIKGGA